MRGEVPGHKGPLNQVLSTSIPVTSSSSGPFFPMQTHILVSCSHYRIKGSIPRANLFYFFFLFFFY